MCVTTTYVWIILMIEHERSERMSDWCTYIMIYDLTAIRHFYNI